MKQPPLIARIFAVVSSLVLAGAYLDYRAGSGQFIGSTSELEAAQDTTNSPAITTTPASTPQAKAVLLPGSKSAVAFPGQMQKGTHTNRTPHALISGSKSGPMFSPARGIDRAPESLAYGSKSMTRVFQIPSTTLVDLFGPPSISTTQSAPRSLSPFPDQVPSSPPRP